MNKEALIAECKLRIERCESALRQRTVSPEVVEVSLELMRIALAAMEATPVGEVVAWNHPTEERSVDFRWIKYVPAGTKLYTVAPPSPLLPDGGE